MDGASPAFERRAHPSPLVAPPDPSTERARSRRVPTVAPSDDHGATGSIKVLIVDDHASLAGALALAIDGQPGLACVGSASTLRDAVSLVGELSPDVVLMDVYLPDGNGIDAIPELTAGRPTMRVLVLTGHTDVDLLSRAAIHGASGFLPKESSVTSIIGAIRAAGEGQMLVDGTTLASILGRLADTSRRSAQRASDIPPLTQREADVLELMGQGLDPHAIAKSLGISVHTCRGYQKGLMAKLGAHSQLEAVVIGIRKGLLAR
jgi:DNA-binding NarL/FixJ family response regulator